MWSSEVTNMIIKGIWETLYMTLVSTLVGCDRTSDGNYPYGYQTKTGLNQMQYYIRF